MCIPLLVALYVFFTGVLSAITIGYFQCRKRPPELLEKALIKRDEDASPGSRQVENWWQRLWREYRQKAFWVPLVVVLIILTLSGSSTAQLAGLPLRAAGIIAAIFVIFSVLKPEKWIARLRKMGFWGGAITLERALGPYAFLKSNAMSKSKTPGK